MKNKLLILLFIFLLSGCSSFYHSHYRKIDKVDASGILAVKKESLSLPEKNRIAQHVSNAKPVLKNMLSENSWKIRSSGKQKTNSVIEKRKQPSDFKTKKTLLPKSILQKPKSPGHLGGIIPVLLLLLSVAFIIWGLTVLIFGIYLLAPVMIVPGVLMILLGGMPVLIQIRNKIAVRRNQDLYEPKH